MFVQKDLLALIKLHAINVTFFCNEKIYILQNRNTKKKNHDSDLPTEIWRHHAINIDSVTKL